jgi:predicted dienelactone hydrolase
MMLNSRLLLLFLLAFAAACSKAPIAADDAVADIAVGTDDAAGDTSAVADDWRKDGAYPVGHADFVLTDAARKRTLRVTIWYPAAESARAAADAGINLADFYPVDSPEHATMTSLLAAAPATCVRAKTHSAASAEPAATTNWPLVAFSHCHTCTRFESTTIMERLASHGIAVIAPDHTGNTIFEGLAGTSAGLTVEFLQTRTSDMQFVLDQALDPTNAAIPANLRGKFDASRIGALGHSFGGVTTGKLLMDDKRPKAGMALAVPMAQPVFPGVTMAQIHVPVGFVLAREDNSITVVGNTFIRNNYNDANPPAWLIEVADAGHFSFADIAGIISGFNAGCGAGKRMDDGSDFTYLDNTIARGIGARLVGAFFGRTLLGEGSADEALMANEPAGVVFPSQRK